MATEMTHEPFHAFAFDGVLGLGLDSLALAPEFSFFGMMSTQKRLQQSSFAVFLADSDDEVSEISFGGHSPERVQGDLHWAPVALPEHGHWQVQIKRIRIGNRTVDFCEDGTCRAVVDTGTSLLAVPSDFADELQTSLEESIKDPPLSAAGEGQDGSSVDCLLAEGAPLYFDIEGMTITLMPGDYARPSLQLTDEEGAEQPEGEAASEDGHHAAHESEAPATAGGSGEEHPQAAAEDAPAHEEGEQEEEEMVLNSCRPAIMPIDLPEPLGPKLFIWGEPVLKKYYTVYHWGEKSVGFGLAIHGNTGSAPATPASLAPAPAPAPSTFSSSPAPSDDDAAPAPAPKPKRRPLLL